MMIERMKPDDPSSAPAMISSLLSSTNPIAAADKSRVRIQQRDHGRHVRAADRNNQQHAEDQRRITIRREKISRVRDASPESTATPTAAIASTARLTKFCPLYVIGRCGRTSCSFPAAIRLPVNVSEPRITSMHSTAIMNGGTVGVAQVKFRRAHQRHAQRAERVAQRRPLRHRRHRHHAERNADDRAQHQRDQNRRSNRNMLSLPHAVLQQRADDRQQHPASRRPTMPRRAVAGELIHFSDENEQRASDQVNQLR